jgi:hypothetical protein
MSNAKIMANQDIALTRAEPIATKGAFVGEKPPLSIPVCVSQLDRPQMQLVSRHMVHALCILEARCSRLVFSRREPARLPEKIRMSESVAPR